MANNHKNRKWTNTAGIVLAGGIRLLGGTLRINCVAEDMSSLPHRRPSPAIYSFWHEMLLMAAYTYSAEICPLISRSADGDIAASAVRWLGGEPIRGSTNHGGKDRGGAGALRSMIRRGKLQHLGIAVDGPIGPRRQVGPGIGVLARHGGMPIIPVGIAPGISKGLGREDLMIRVPMPFCRCWIVLGKAVIIPAGARRGESASIVQRAMDDVQSRAEKYAQGAAAPSSFSIRQMKHI
ncbi:MAG: DUF374 domain-containing protein [Planctomycetes bacterium]|nr:DUF374 domain-containing protein [Planctomycetota bacterium]